MKKYVYIILLLFTVSLSQIGIAQTYQSYFGEEFTNWYTFYDIYDADYSEVIRVENSDTILSNGITYKRAYKNGKYYHFGIREDIATGSLFINKEGMYGIEGSYEILVSRMDLNEGDKFYFSPSADLDHFDDIQTDEIGRYTWVDSVYYKDNRKQIRCATHYQPFVFDIPLTFIEGIGPNISFDPLIGYAYIAICFNCYENEDGLWKSDIKDKFGNAMIPTDECLFNNTTIPNIKTDSPFEIIQRKGEIEIQLDITQLGSGVVDIYTMQGQFVYTRLFSEEKNLIISTSGFPNGTYIIAIRDNNAEKVWRGVKKIIL